MGGSPRRYSFIGVLRSENVLLHSFLSASKVFPDGRHKDIHIDRLCNMVVHPGISAACLSSEKAFAVIAMMGMPAF